MIQRFIVLFMLIACSKEDILHRRIRVRWLIYFAIAGFLCQLLIKKQSLPVLLPGMVPGFLILIFSVVSQGSIGMGDGMLLMAIGIYLGVVPTVWIIVYAVFLSAFCALFVHFVKKKDKDYEMPFVPFVLVAFLINIVFGKW